MYPKHQLFSEPATQGDCDVVAAQLRHSGNRGERDRLVSIAKRRGYLLPAHFADDCARAKEAAGEVATFSATGAEPPDEMTEDRAEILASFSDGAAMLAKQGLKGNPDPVGDGNEGEGALRASADRLLAKNPEGREILKRRGWDRESIERMQRPSC
jgi:hypothetical protein